MSCQRTDRQAENQAERKKHYAQHRITANSGYSVEKCYFRDQLTNNKADKFASLLHATCVIQNRYQRFDKK